MMRLCPHHSLEKWLIIHAFYNALLYNTRMTIDAVDDSALMDKPLNEAYHLIENMAHNHYQWGNERAQVEKTPQKGVMFEVNGLDHVSAKADALNQKINNLTITTPATVSAVTLNCDICGIQEHVSTDRLLLTGTMPDRVNYVQGNPYSNTYNPRWRNHPNFS